MDCFALRRAGYALAFVLLFGAVPAMAATPPTLFSVRSATPQVLAQGAQKSWPIKISEDTAMDAVFQGGMWLPNPSGGRIYAKYSRHILHPNGTWTWIGKVNTVHGQQSVVLTFGPHGVFGLVPQSSGYPLRIVTKDGQTSIVETSAQAMTASPEALRVKSQPDFAVPPRVMPKSALARAAPRASAPTEVQAAASSGPVTIDVMVAYTSGFVSELGNQPNALTRIQNLVDLTNQAYVDSGINQQIRLVFTTEVDYPDDTSNDSALDDITGFDPNGNPVQIPASLQDIASQRVQYGADLVVLIRSFNNATQNGCGEGWLIGGGEAPIVPSQDYIWGYSVVSDGSNGGYYCLDTTFAHELGHNMGDAHDRAHANGPGAYPYSYGYLGGGTNGFSTIMAYGSATDTPLAVFSNPNISICQNQPCGVADSSASSADNAHSMNNTAALIAQFEPAATGTPPPESSSPGVHNDVNGDGKSDLLWYNASAHLMTFWLMDGPTMTSWTPLPVPPGYTPIATGDFYGNGYTDIVWADASGNVYMWVNNGNDTFTSDPVTNAMPGWQIVGTVDINGDGKTDLIWYNTTSGQMTYWLMDGPTMTSWSLFNTNPGLQLVATGHFNGSAYGNIIWKLPTGAMYMWLFNGSGTFTYQEVGQYPTGWVSAGTGDVNGDGKTDLFWYNPTTGQMTYWLMDGATLTSWNEFHTNTGLQPLATGMFDGSHAGLTWETADGGLYMWQFNVNDGASFTYYSLGSYPTDWVPIQ